MILDCTSTGFRDFQSYINHRVHQCVLFQHFLIMLRLFVSTEGRKVRPLPYSRGGEATSNLHNVIIPCFAHVPYCVVFVLIVDCDIEAVVINLWIVVYGELMCCICVLPTIQHECPKCWFFLTNECVQVGPTCVLSTSTIEKSPFIITQLSLL